MSGRAGPLNLLRRVVSCRARLLNRVVPARLLNRAVPARLIPYFVCYVNKGKKQKKNLINLLFLINCPNCHENEL